jgi:serine/threonine protein kinase
VKNLPLRKVSKSKQRDRVIGTGSFKKVRFAIKLNDMQVYAVAKVKVETQQQPVAQEEESRFLKLLKGLDGVSQIEKEVLVQGKNDQDKLLIIQPYYNSGDLFTNIDRGLLTPKEKHQITLDLLKGLASIHSKDIIHRDIKPENIFLSKNEQGELRAFIGDFGLSTMNTDDKKKAESGGSPRLYSPEYVRAICSLNTSNISKVTNEKLDSWTLGTTLLMLYTRNIPPWFDSKYINDLGYVLITINDITAIDPSWLDTVGPEVIRNLIQDLIQIDTTSRLSAQEALTKYEHDIKVLL